jgi:Bifunctional DNA primase/polymerase, N-terminal/Primase C terminal 1 (PriCT-1)
MTEPALPSALAWIGRGHGIFPLWWPVEHNGQRFCACGRLCGRQAAKHPVARYAPHGHLSATTNAGIAKLWFGLRVPEANLGIATEKLVVVDIDPRHGGDESLRAIEREHGELPLTWRALTGSGGAHVIFAAPAGVEIGNVVAENEIRFGREPPLGPGVDIRARGGYIVAPPSRHMSGRSYCWSGDHHPADVPLAVAPDWLIERLTTARGTTTTADDAPPPPIGSNVWAQLTRQPITEYRDMAAAKIAGHLFRHWCDYQLVLGLLHAWNSAWCQPPLGYQELTNIVDRIAILEAERLDRKHARSTS